MSDGDAIKHPVRASSRARWLPIAGAVVVGVVGSWRWSSPIGIGWIVAVVVPMWLAAGLARSRFAAVVVCLLSTAGVVVALLAIVGTDPTGSSTASLAWFAATFVIYCALIAAAVVCEIRVAVASLRPAKRRDD